MKIVVWKGCMVESETEVTGPEIEIHVDPYEKILYVYQDNDDSKTLEWS